MTAVPSIDVNTSTALVERRLGQRHQVFLLGKALSKDRVIDVTFRDLSARGARLIVTEPIAHAGELPVLILKEGLILRSRIIWAKPPMFGLEFREAIDAQVNCPPMFAALADAWREWKGIQPN